MTLTSSTIADYLPWQSPSLLRTEEDYQRALTAVADLMHADLNSEQSDLLDLLVALIEKYEEENYPIPEGAPHSILEFLWISRTSNRLSWSAFWGQVGLCLKW